MPLSSIYITQIVKQGAKILYSLKWFNAVMITTDDPFVLEAINDLPFVERIMAVGNRTKKMSNDEQGIHQNTSIQTIKGVPLPAP